MELTQEQIDFLNECTRKREYNKTSRWDVKYKHDRGVWSVNKETGLVDIEGNFDVSDRVIAEYIETPDGRTYPKWKWLQVKSKDFKGIKFGVVTGYFNCSYMGLESLEGAPIKVMDDFDCSINKLKSLKGAPLEVGRDFRCEINKLETLEGSPKEVPGDFVCNNNKLVTLKGGPEKARSFECQNNLLTDLIGSPKELVLESEGYGYGQFKCQGNKLTTLKGITKSINNLDCADNPIISLEHAPHIEDYGYRRSRFPKKFRKIYEIMEDNKISFFEAIDVFEKKSAEDINWRREAIKKDEQMVAALIKEMRKGA